MQKKLVISLAAVLMMSGYVLAWRATNSPQIIETAAPAPRVPVTQPTAAPAPPVAPAPVQQAPAQAPTPGFDWNSYTQSQREIDNLAQETLRPIEITPYEVDRPVTCQTFYGDISNSTTCY